MKAWTESLDITRVLGYLGADNVLYCSPGCAAMRGQADAAPVDKDEYPALVRRGSLTAGRCPVCRSEYALDWSADDRP